MGLRNERVPLPKNQVIPEGRFEGNSAYVNDFIGSQAEKNPQFRPVGQLKVGQGKFQGNSSYSGDYMNKGSPIRAERVPLPKNQVMPEGQFLGKSSYGDNYIPKQVSKVSI